MERYETFWPRFVALFIDGIILSIAKWIFEIVPSSSEAMLSLVRSLIIENVTFAYSVVMVAKYGQTVGKMAMNIKVVDNYSEGPVTFEQAFKREAVPIFLVSFTLIANTVMFSDFDWQNNDLSILGYIIVFLPLFMSSIWSILEIVTMLFDKKSRALHDKIADTVVIKT